MASIENPTIEMCDAEERRMVSGQYHCDAYS